MYMDELRVIISGGGTGGHIFPAISIAGALREAYPDVKLLFVGALGRMEMQRVPAAGYEIIGLPVRGLLRPLWKPANIGVLWDFLRSKRMVKQTLRDFKPHVAVGVGGYASSATLNAAYELGIPCLIQEQNSFAGLTNKTLAKKASKICVAYEGMERFFPKDRILLTGNPVRQSLLNASLTREECAAAFGLNPAKPVVLLVGGSLGARTLNESVIRNLSRIAASQVQFIWQTGSYYKKEIEQMLDVKGKPSNLVVMDWNYGWSWDKFGDVSNVLNAGLSLACDAANLGMNLVISEAVDDIATGFFEPLRPLDVVEFIKTRPQFE